MDTSTGTTILRTSTLQLRRNVGQLWLFFTIGLLFMLVLHMLRTYMLYRQRRQRLRDEAMAYHPLKLGSKYSELRQQLLSLAEEGRPACDSQEVQGKAGMHALDGRFLVLTLQRPT